MKRSTFLKSLIAAPAAIAVAAKTEAQPSLPLGMNTKKIRITLDREMLESRKQWIDVSEPKVNGGYLVPPDLADAIKEAMSKYPG